MHKAIAFMGMLVILVAVILSGCTMDPEAQSGGVTQQLKEAIYVSYYPISAYFADKSVYGVAVSSTSPDSGDWAYIFQYTSFTAEAIDYTISGTLSLEGTVSGDTVTMDLDGTLSLDGGPVSDISFNLSAEAPWDSVNQTVADDPTSLSGTVTVDGTVYNIADFGLLDEDEGDMQITQGVQLLENMEGAMGYVQVAVGPSGDAVVVWVKASSDLLVLYEDKNNLEGDIYAAAYSADTGQWSDPAMVSNTAQNDAALPRAVIDDSGNGFVVWVEGRYTEQSSGSSMECYERVCARRYRAGSWESIVQVNENTYTEGIDEPGVYNPRVSVDPDGSAVFVWQQRITNADQNIYARCFDPDIDTWPSISNQAEPVCQNDSTWGYADSPRVGFDRSTGKALVVWAQHNSDSSTTAGHDIHVIRSIAYDPSNGWSAAIDDLSDTTRNAANPALAWYGSRKAVVVWEQDDISDASNHTNSIYATQYQSGLWGAQLKLSDLSGAPSTVIAQEASVGAHPGSGAIVAAWHRVDTSTESTDPSYLGVYGARFNESSWEARQLIYAGSGGDYNVGAYWPQVEVDAGGNGVLLCSDITIDVTMGTDFQNTYHSVVYTEGSGWGAGKQVSSEMPFDPGTSSEHNLSSLAIDANNNAFTGWPQWDGEYMSMYVYRFSY
ncbi:MAG: hypothetical protein ACOC7U_05575 [Spirochaetota bacterium]